MRVEPRAMHQSSIRLLDYSGNTSYVGASVPFQPEPNPSVCNRVNQVLKEKDRKGDDPPTERLFTPDIKETGTQFSSQIRTEDEAKINESTQFTDPGRKRESALAAYRRRSKS